jgi:two-component system, cell cycle sensor histidine kinase and response regulator CckA
MVTPRATPPRPPQSGARIRAARPALSSPTILLVDDESSLRRGIARGLRGAGYRVLEAGSAEAALWLLSVTLEPPTLLLSDVEMPGASGAELLERARRVLPGLPAQLMSGCSREELLERQMIGPHQDLLQKPFGLSCLLAKLERLLSYAVTPAASRAS